MSIQSTKEITFLSGNYYTVKFPLDFTLIAKCESPTKIDHVRFKCLCKEEVEVRDENNQLHLATEYTVDDSNVYKI